MHKKIIVFILICLFFSVTLFAQNETTEFDTEVAEIPILSLNQFLEEAVKNPFFEAILIDQLAIQYNEVLKMPPEDWLLSVKLNYQLAGADSTLAHEIKGGVGLSKIFNESGTAITTAVGADFLIDNVAVGDFYFGLVQPIGQNAFGRKNRWMKELIRFDDSVIEIQIVEAYEDYLASLMVLYYEWALNYERLQRAQKTYDRSVALLERIKNKNQAYGKLDLSKLVLQADGSKVKLLQTKSSYIKIENEVRMVLGRDASWRGRPLYQEYLDVNKFDVEANKERFFKEGRTVQAMNLLLSKEELSKKISADELLPSANFIANYNVGGGGDGYTQTDAIHNLFLGFDINYAIWSERIRSRVAVDEINIEKIQLENENKLLKLKLQIENIAVELKTDYERIMLAKEMLNLVQQVTLNEEKNYELGDSEVNFLIEEINNEDAFEREYLSERSKFNTLVIEWLRLTDSLLTKELSEL